MIRLHTGQPGGMPSIVGDDSRMAVSRSRNSFWMVNALVGSCCSWAMRCCTATGTCELGLIVVLLSCTLAEKYQGDPEPLGCDALIQVALPRGPNWKPVIWNSAHSRLNSTGALLPAPSVAIFGRLASGTSGKPSLARTAPAKFALVRLIRSWLVAGFAPAGTLNGSEPLASLTSV